MKKVLIITYYWPPSGGGGVQRWLKFAKYLPEYDCEPIIVAPLNADYPSVDSSLLQDINPNLKVIKVPIWEPYRLFKFLTGKKKNDKVNTGFLFDDTKQSLAKRISLWLRGNLLIPDPRVFWVRPVVKTLLKQINEINPDVIITTGPPHSVHLSGLKLQRKTGIKWIADFRDPWSTIDYLKFFNLSKWAQKKQRKLEHKVLSKADLVLSVSENWKKELQALGARNVEVITNGYDEEDFKNFKKRDTGKFIITYTGLITSLRNPIGFWEIVDNLCKENEQFFEKLELRLIGNIDPQVKSSIDKLKYLKGKTIYKGYLSHSEVIKEYEESSLLLLLLTQSDNAAGHIPGKLFEYLAARTPILALGEKGGDVERILQECGGGELFEDEFVVETCEYLRAEINVNNIQNNNFLKYSRMNLTKLLNDKIQLMK